MLKTIISICLILLNSLTLGYHYAIFTEDSSHYVPMIPLAKEMLNRGHKVTFILDSVAFNKIHKIMKFDTRVQNIEYTIKKKDTHNAPSILEYVRASEILQQVHIHNAFLKNLPADTSDIVLQVKQKFDSMSIEDLPDLIISSVFMVLTHAFNEPKFLKHKRIPNVVFFPTTPTSLLPHNQISRLSVPLSNYSDTELRTSFKLSLLSYIISLGMYIDQHFVSPIVTYKHYRKVGLPMPYYVFENAMRTITYTAGAIGVTERNTRLPPNFIPVGFPGSTTTGDSIVGVSDTLRTDVMKWLDKRNMNNDNVIFISFGSIAELTLSNTEALAKALLDNRWYVLWSLRTYTTEQLKEKNPDLYSQIKQSNIYLTDFVSQKDVLEHPSIKIFHTHGGQNSLGEALVRGVPLLMTPLFGDQISNSVNLREKGCADIVYKGLLDVTCIECINEIKSKYEYYLINPVGVEMLQKMKQRVQLLGNKIKEQTNIGKFLDHIEECTGVENYDWCIKTYVDIEFSGYGAGTDWARSIPYIGNWLTGFLCDFKADIWFILCIEIYVLYKVLKFTLKMTYKCLKKCIYKVIKRMKIVNTTFIEIDTPKKKLL